ncbi:MAG: DEAD/DEAH box helicase [Nitrospirota bacterium]
MIFEEFKLSKDTLKSISELGFEEPTPIQVSAIPLIMNGRDIVGQAQTGTGKTAAFGIPIAENMHMGKNPFAIILEPTRELAVQVSQEIHKLGKYRNVSVLPVYGGTSIERQIKSLHRGVNVVVGTPGRIIDLMNRKKLSLSEIRIVVLDEADEMLDMGFLEDIEMILGAVPAGRQTLLFSATMPQPIMNIARRHMKNPAKVRINAQEVVVTKIRQAAYEVREESKVDALSRLLDVENPQLAIVFCHTKREVDDVFMKLSQLGYNAGAIHGDFTQVRREEVMKRFRAGMLDILVATDVAARGLDIKDVSHVINYSIPQNPDSYVHRIGRTGRAGRSGSAITFVTPWQYKHLRLIEKTAKTIIHRKKLPSSADVVRAKEKNIVRDIAKIIQDKRHEGYFQAVKELSGDHSFSDIAAAALCAAYGEMQERPAEKAPSKDPHVHLIKTEGKNGSRRSPDILNSGTSKSHMYLQRGRKHREKSFYRTF